MQDSNKSHKIPELNWLPCSYEWDFVKDCSNENIFTLHPLLHRIAINQSSFSDAEDKHNFSATYAQECKYMQENNTLQQDCLILYKKCHDLQTQFKEDLITDYITKNMYCTIEADNWKQQKIINQDRQRLISFIETQKRSLIHDMQALVKDKDEKILQLERYRQDVNELLLSDLHREKTYLNKHSANNILPLHHFMFLINELERYENLVMVKEQAFDKLQKKFRLTMQNEEDVDEIHKLSMKWQEEVKAKTLEILGLKNKVCELQQQIDLIIEQTAPNLTVFCTTKRNDFKHSGNMQNLDELKMNMENILNKKVESKNQLVKSEDDVKKVPYILKCAREQYEYLKQTYDKICYKLEISQFQQSDGNKQERDDLRKQLKTYLGQIIKLSTTIENLTHEKDAENPLKEDNQKPELKCNTGIYGFKDKLSPLEIKLQFTKPLHTHRTEKEWDDMLEHLKIVQKTEEDTQRELQLRTMELENLNKVFAEQNEQLRKLEQFSMASEIKRQQEIRTMRKAFQIETDSMAEQLNSYRAQIKQQNQLIFTLQNAQKLPSLHSPTNPKAEEKIMKCQMAKNQLKNKTISKRTTGQLELEAKPRENNETENVNAPETTHNSHTGIENSLTDDHLDILNKLRQSEYNRKKAITDLYSDSSTNHTTVFKRSLKIPNKTVQTNTDFGEMFIKRNENEKAKKVVAPILKDDLNKTQWFQENKDNESSNLIDDYKKLIRTSAVRTRKCCFKSDES